MTLSTPQLMEIFGARPVTLPTQNVSVGGLLGNATRVDTVSIPGVAAGDRLSATLPASQGTNSLILNGIEATGQNTAQVRASNYSPSTQSYGSRSFIPAILDSQHLRQTFAISDYMGEDCWLAGVDSETSSGKIFRTTNGWASSVPVYAIPAMAVRQFLSLNSSKQAQLAVCSDPGIVLKSVDGGLKWSNIGRLGNEDVLFCAELEGGPGANTGRVLVGSGSGRIWSSNDNGNTFSDKGVVLSGYDQVWGLIYVGGHGEAATYLALLNDNTGVRPPAIAVVNNYGADASLLCTLGSPGIDHQGFIKLASGAVLCGLSNGNLYRLEAPYTSPSSVFSTSAVALAETKPRAFAQWTDGTVIMGGQNSGYLWTSTDDGMAFQREHRVGYGDAVISLKAVANDMIVVGTGQGLLTGKPFKAALYRGMRDWSKVEGPV
jgi:hypothetical protein